MTNEPLDFPDAPGWYAFEGYVKPFAKQMEHEVVRVHWGKITQRWQVVWSRGHHPADMLVGKWTRLYMPWEQPAPVASVPDEVVETLRLLFAFGRGDKYVSERIDRAAAWLDTLA